MEEKYWLEKWQKNDIAFHEQNINADLIAYINVLMLKPGDCIFVPLFNGVPGRIRTADLPLSRRKVLCLP
jgi:hypothetical protein